METSQSIVKNIAPKETAKTVQIINSFLQRVGFLSYTSTGKVHGAANFVTFVLTIACSFQFIGLYVARDDSEKLFEYFIDFVFSAMALFKLISLRKHHNRWSYIFNQLSSLENEELNNIFTSDADYQSEDEDDNLFRNHVNNYTKKFKKTSTIIADMYDVIKVIFLLIPLVGYLVSKIRKVDKIEYSHILPGWAPFDQISVIGYLLQLLGEACSFIYAVRIQIAFDLTTVGIIMFICGQFRLLRDYCSRIGGSGKLCKLSTRRDKRASFRIKHCHRINMILINCITELDKLLKYIYGVFFFLATLTLCCVAVRMKSAKYTVSHVGLTFGQMIGVVTQLYLICYCGDAILHESSLKMGEGPFAAAYWCLSPRIRRDLVLLSTSMIKPQHMHAGPFNYLDLPTFVQIIRTAYSYYAVLSQK